MPRLPILAVSARDSASLKVWLTHTLLIVPLVLFLDSRRVPFFILDLEARSACHQPVLEACGVLLAAPGSPRQVESMSPRAASAISVCLSEVLALGLAC